MDPVSLLLFNSLAQRRGINLPGVGSLSVVSTPARMQEDGRLAPPVSRVVFSPEEVDGYDNLLWAIGRSSGKDEGQSREIYDRFLAQVCTADKMEIPSVGTVQGEQFTPAGALYQALNPAGDAPVALKKTNSNRQLFFWVATAVIVGAGLAAGLIVYLNSRPGPYDVPYAPGTPAVAETPQTPATAEEEIENSLEALAEQETAASPAEAPAAQPAQTPPAAKTEAKPAVSAPAAAKPAPAPGQTAPATRQTHYYVVVGVFSTDENAERKIGQLRAQDAKPNYRKLPLSNGKIMIYTADETTREAADRARRTVLGVCPEAWIFKK